MIKPGLYTHLTIHNSNRVTGLNTCDQDIGTNREPNAIAMLANNLTIDTLRFSLRIDSSGRGEVLLQRCSALFHQRLRNDLARLAQRLAGSGRTPALRIERLALDLGLFTWANGESELRERFLSQLEQRLRLLLHGASEEARERAEDSGLSRFATSLCSSNAAAWAAEAGKPSLPAVVATEESGAPDATREESGAIDVAREGSGAIDATRHASPVTEPMAGLVTYLQYGVCPTLDNWPGQRLDHELIDALRSQAARWRPLLARLCLDSVALRRLRQTFQGDTLHYVAQTLAGDSLLAGFSEQTSAAAHRQTVDTLPFIALHFFLQHPEKPLPLPEGDWPLPVSDTAALPWLQRVLLTLTPQSPAVERWLPVLCYTPMLRARLAQYVSVCVSSQQGEEQYVRPHSRHRSPPEEDELLPPGEAAALLRLQRELTEPGFGRSAIEAGLLRLRHSSVWRARLAQYLSKCDLSTIREQSPYGQRNPAPRDIDGGETVAASLPPLPTHSVIEQASYSLRRDGMEKRTSLSLSDDERLPVTNAGVVLLWPLLPGLFQQLRLVNEQRFVDVAAQYQAVGWLDSLSWGDATPVEWRTPLNKLLCALPLDEPLPDWLPDSDRTAQLDAWLDALPERLPGLQRCGVIDLRQLFLQRPGTLTQQARQWTIHVKSDASDLLLRAIPWSRQQVLLPWCACPLLIDW